MLNDCIHGCGFAVKVRCALISGQFKAPSGRKKRDLLAGNYWMNIFGEEVESVDLVGLLIGELEMEKKTRENLETENKKLYDELTEEVTQEKLRADELLSETESLKKYIEKLERNNETDKNGKDLPTVENNKKHTLNLSDSSIHPTLQAHTCTSNQSDKYSTLP